MKSFLPVLFVFIGFSSYSQVIDKTHALRLMGTIAPGYLLNKNYGTVYLSSSVDYYLNEKVSIYGAADWYLESLPANKPLRTNHSIFAGINYHFKEKAKFDPFIGFQPGVSYVKLRNSNNVSNIEIVPIGSIMAGVNYYVGSIFNFFVHLRLLNGRAVERLGGPYSLSEIRFMAGLGFNFGVKSKS
jgi:hypothetical protein